MHAGGARRRTHQPLWIRDPCPWEHEGLVFEAAKQALHEHQTHQEGQQQGHRKAVAEMHNAGGHRQAAERDVEGGQPPQRPELTIEALLWARSKRR